MASKAVGVLRNSLVKSLQTRAGSSGGHCWLCAHLWLRGPAAVTYAVAVAGCGCTNSGGSLSRQQVVGQLWAHWELWRPRLSGGTAGFCYGCMTVEASDGNCAGGVQLTTEGASCR